jgi:hypothetical protein
MRCPVSGVLAEHPIKRVDQIGRRGVGGINGSKVPDHD